MISVGVVLGGPDRVPIEELLRGTMNAVRSACNDCQATSCRPSVNVVFYVPGPLTKHEGLTRIEAARYSRKRNLLLVAVPVPEHLVSTTTAIDFVIDALTRAIRIASDTFSRKGGEPFDLLRATEIIDKARRILVERQ